LDPIAKENVPEAIQKRVEDAWKEHYVENDEAEDAPMAGAGGLPNPVVKVPLHVWATDNGELCIDQVNVVQPNIVQGNVPAAAAPAAPTANANNDAAHADVPQHVWNQVGVGAMPNGITQEQYINLLNQIHQLRTSVTTLHQQMDSHFASQRNHMDTHMNRLSNNVRHFGGNIRGAFVRSANAHAEQQQVAAAHAEGNPTAAAGVDEPPGMATLVDRPRTLLEVWHEWTVGTNGSKPAREFTMRERNNRCNGIKQKYYRRKYIWDMVGQLVREGDTAEHACYRIRQCYGFNYSITQIINKL
jgi:hypothetical protein